MADRAVLACLQIGGGRRDLARQKPGDPALDLGLGSIQRLREVRRAAGLGVHAQKVALAVEHRAVEQAAHGAVLAVGQVDRAHRDKPQLATRHLGVDERLHLARQHRAVVLRAAERVLAAHRSLVVDHDGAPVGVHIDAVDLAGHVHAGVDELVVALAESDLLAQRREVGQKARLAADERLQAAAQLLDLQALQLVERDEGVFGEAHLLAGEPIVEDAVHERDGVLDVALVHAALPHGAQPRVQALQHAVREVAEREPAEVGVDRVQAQAAAREPQVRALQVALDGRRRQVRLGGDDALGEHARQQDAPARVGIDGTRRAQRDAARERRGGGAGKVGCGVLLAQLDGEGGERGREAGRLVDLVGVLGIAAVAVDKLFEQGRRALLIAVGGVERPAEDDALARRRQGGGVVLLHELRARAQRPARLERGGADSPQVKQRVGRVALVGERIRRGRQVDQHHAIVG